MHLKNMSTIFASAYIHTKELSYLTRATQYAQQALGIQTKHHLHAAECNSLLGARLGALYEATNELQYLQEAIQAAEAALKALPKTNIKRALALANLSRMMVLKYMSDMKSTNSQWYLEQSIKMVQKAVEMQQSSILKAESLVQLGTSYMLSTDPEFQRRGLEAWMQAWGYENQRPMNRIRLAISIIDFLKDKDLGKAAAIAKQAVRLFTLLNTQTLNIVDQQYIASASTGLVTDACSLLLETEGPEEALRILELGRARTVSLLIDSRSDSTQVKAVDKELGAEYDRLQAEVNASHHKMDELGGMPHHQFKRRMESVGELQACINKIQRVPGLERFLKEPEINELKASAAEGPVVVINITSIRSDAIVISDVDTIFNLKLDLSWSDAKRRALADLTSYQDLQKWGAQNRKFTALLAWLWKGCVKPVLDALGLKPGPVLPRVWWIGTGIAGLFPFHAGGKGTEHVYQRIISSYIPTIKALMYARRRPIASGNRLLLVTMPKTPGKADLVSDDPDTLAGSAFQVKHLQQPSSQTVLDNFHDSNVVHFVCHGESVQGKPSSSPLFLLKNGSELDRLTVEDISHVHLKDAKLAYLAACSTAQNNEILADEVLHLASGFQVAAFSQVIGSTWVADHEISSAITKTFYAKLQLDLSPRNIATALHESILEVQSEVVGQPLAWASYIHMGA